MSESVVYHVYNASSGPPPVPPVAHKYVKINFLEGLVEPVVPVAVPTKVETGLAVKVSKLLNKLAIIFAAIGLVFILIAYVPEVSDFGNYKLSGEEVSQLNESHEEKVIYQPAFDPKLPKTNKILVPSIGIDSEIQESTFDNYEEALKKGIWRVSDFGSPYARQAPTILAAHRYGYLAWTWNFRKTSSFMNLPKAKVGDTVTIVWQQRKYVYEIYSESKGDQINDYSADLILYTCESLTGPVRIFKYARLLEI